MSGKTRHDMIENDTIRERVGVTPIVEKLVENRLRWFGHVERRHQISLQLILVNLSFSIDLYIKFHVDVVVRRVDQMEESHFKRGRGRPKKIIRETIMKDLEVNELDSNFVYDKTLSRNLIYVADPT